MNKYLTYPSRYVLSVVCALLPLLFGCQTVSKKPLTEAQFEQLTPVTLVTDAGEEPSISIEDGMDHTMLMMGFQGGAMGGAFMSLAMEAKANAIRTERIKQMGEAWTRLDAVDADQLLKTTMSTSNTASSMPWFEDVRTLNDMREGSMLKYASTVNRPTLGMQVFLIFSGDLSYITFQGKYIAYWGPADGGPVQAQTYGQVNHVVFVPGMSIDSASNALAWQAQIMEPESMLIDGYKAVSDLVRKDLTATTPAHPGKGIEAVCVWNIYGGVEGRMAPDRVLLRNRMDQLFSVPIPEVVNMHFKTAAILRAPNNDNKDLPETLRDILKLKGIAATIVDNTEEVSTEDVLIRIGNDWGWDFSTFLNAASISLHDPKSGKLLGFGSAHPGGMKMIKDSDQKVMEDCWRIAVATDLAQALKQVTKSGTEL